MTARGVVSRLACSVTPSLAPSAAMGSARRHSFRQPLPQDDRPERPESLGDRASSKLTLDDELFDILYAFGETETFIKPDNVVDADDDGKPLTRQALLERIRQKKEVIGKLRCQSWNMSRKRRTLKLAQKYLEQHESKVSKSHLYMEELRKRFRILRRYFSNLKTYLIPWEGKIKRIESHFGSVVSSYFTFLRWIVFINIIMTLLIVAFVVLPESFADAAAEPGRRNRTASRKVIPLTEKVHADELAVVWHYDGYLRYSALFYGFYSDERYLGPNVKYALPLAYFLVTLFIFAYSFFAILRKMAANARMSKLSASKAEQYIFNWKVFTGWDYTIGNSETAANTVMAVVIKLRESIADIRVAAPAKFRCLQFSLRILANAIILSMLAFSIYCISFAVQRSQTAVEQEGNLFTKNQVPSVVATITHVFPMIFDLIGRMENYHPRTALRAHLVRVLVLYALNYGTLCFTLFEKMNSLRNKEDISPRYKRQMGGRNPNIPRPPPFASRTFSDRSQMLAFAERAARFDLNRTTRAAPTSPKPFTVTPQFGPVNVNNPNAILRNGSYRPFETQRVGPNPLPIFTPPPRPARPPSGNGRIDQQYGGPDFAYTRGTTRIPVITPDPTNIEVTDNPMTGRKVELPSVHPPGTDSSLKQLPEAAFKRTDDVSTTIDICWETIIGQEIVKLVTMDLIVTILSILVIDFLRGLWIRHCSSWWCWDIETTFPEYGEFKVAENVLHIINNQGMIWLGFFFAPLLPAINNIKLIVIMYIRGWAVMTCNVPARDIFRASRSSNFYLFVLLLWLLLCTIPVGYVIASMRPSSSCGPFAKHEFFYTVMTSEFEKRVDPTILGYLRAIASPSIVVLLLIVLALIIYYLISLVRALREANTDLQQQLVHERTEEKKKIFELAGGGKKRQDERPDRNRNRRIAQYVPLVEQQRRETWRAYHEMEEAVRASDSSESEEEDAIESPDMLVRVAAPPPPSSTAETVAVAPFHPSLASLEENELGEEQEEHLSEQPAMLHHSASMNSKVRFGSPSGSTDVQSNVVDIATPEEIRSMLRPLLEMKLASEGARGFPRDIGSPPTMIISSRRESKRNSFLSLYDLACQDSHVPSMVSAQALREPQADVHVTPRSADQRQGKKFETKDIQPDFQPWPSIDEVRLRREQLLKKTPLPITKASDVKPRTNGSPDRPPVPLHARFQTEPTSSGTDDERRSASPTRRFRISVSPTRRLTSEEREGTQSGKRIYSIKQQSVAPSSTSLGQSSDLTSPRAPRVVFDEDDSPRVQQ